MMRLDREFWDGLGQGGQSRLVILNQLPLSTHFSRRERSGVSNRDEVELIKSSLTDTSMALHMIGNPERLFVDF